MTLLQRLSVAVATSVAATMVAATTFPLDHLPTMFALCVVVLSAGALRGERPGARPEANTGDTADNDAFFSKVPSFGLKTRSLDLNNRLLDPTDMTVLAQLISTGALARLEQVALSLNSLGDAGTQAFAEAASGGSHGVNPGALLPKLDRLSVFDNYIRARGVSALFKACAHGAFPSLSELDLGNNPLGDEGVAAFADAASGPSVLLPNLTRLQLWSVRVGDVGIQALAGALAKDGGQACLPALTDLRLWGNQIGDEGLAGLADACAKGALPLLSSLRMWSNRIGDHGLAAFVGAGTGGRALPKLKRLDLDRNQIGDAGLAALAQGCTAAIGAFPLLETLYLGNNDICDGGIVTLADACRGDGAAFARLRVLSLGGAWGGGDIGADGLDALVRILRSDPTGGQDKQALHSLQTLWLDDLPLASGEPAATLKAACRARGIDMRSAR
jgi:hypothetical protein